MYAVLILLVSRTISYISGICIFVISSTKCLAFPLLAAQLSCGSFCRAELSMVLLLRIFLISLCFFSVNSPSFLPFKLFCHPFDFWIFAYFTLLKLLYHFAVLLLSFVSQSLDTWLISDVCHLTNNFLREISIFVHVCAWRWVLTQVEVSVVMQCNSSMNVTSKLNFYSLTYICQNSSKDWLRVDPENISLIKYVVPLFNTFCSVLHLLLPMTLHPLTTLFKPIPLLLRTMFLWLRTLYTSFQAIGPAMKREHPHFNVDPAKYFVSRVRTNLHIILCLSPSHHLLKVAPR